MENTSKTIIILPNKKIYLSVDSENISFSWSPIYLMILIFEFKIIYPVNSTILFELGYGNKTKYLFRYGEQFNVF